MVATARLRIGELAALAGVSTRAIRHYHRIGLLPEPGREANGYRTYELAEVVRLLRVRRLVELGLSLDEVADALGDSESAELAGILTGLAADLAGQERRIAEQRERIEALLARGGDLSCSTEQQAALAELARIAGPEHPGLEREQLIAELLEPTLGPEQASQTWDIYQKVLAEPELTEPLLALSRRFEDLIGLDPGDPAVAELAREAGDYGPAIGALLPAEVRDGPGDPAAAETLLGTVTVGMDPAQARCLSLMFEHWRAAS
jgi:DNA-binding transcriptional MerR regulator